MKFAFVFKFKVKVSFPLNLVSNRQSAEAKIKMANTKQTTSSNRIRSRRRCNFGEFVSMSETNRLTTRTLTEASFGCRGSSNVDLTSVVLNFVD